MNPQSKMMPGAAARATNAPPIGNLLAAMELCPYLKVPLMRVVLSGVLDATLNWKEIGLCKMEFVLSQPTGMDDRKRKPGRSSSVSSKGEPGWADGLRQIYNSVVHEPLPDSFDDLLKKLDRAKHERD